MKTFEGNLLLALSTGFALALLVMTAALFGAPGGWIKYPVLAVVCSVGFMLLNPPLARRMGRVTAPLVRPMSPDSAAWAVLFPMALLLAAAAPLFWPGHDYGLMIVIAAVWAGVTFESAWKVRRA